MRWMRRLLVLALIPPAFVCLAALGNGRLSAPTRFAGSPFLTEPQPPLEEAVSLRVMTFNIADGYGFTNNRKPRMRAIANELRRLDPDLVGLQEAFIAADRQILEAELEGSRLVHRVRFPGATIGNGLWILSAYPIEESWFHRYQHSGSWWRLWEGDWWAGKGVGLARIRLPNGALVDFFDTHAQAGRGNPANEGVRLGQMAELARFVRSARTPGAPAFVVGDFNTRSSQPDYQLLVRESPLVRVMSIESRIDHVFAIDDPAFRYEVETTLEISGRIPSPRPEVFVSRVPTLGEIGDMLFGAPDTTRLSDHPGYMSTVTIRPIPAAQRR